MTILSQPLLIAFASSDGIAVDGHFGSCEQFYIYSLDADTITALAPRSTEGGRGTEKNAVRANSINDCQLLFCASIGGPAAARVIRAGIHPMKSKPVNQAPALIQDQLSELQARVKSQSLPPWLAKLTGQKVDLNERFEVMV